MKDLDVEFVRKDGTTFPGRINSTAVFSDQHDVLFSRGTVRDITQEVELEHQLLQAQKLESLGTLAGGIAHDFNNLLTSMMGFSQLAMLSFEPNSPTYKNLDRVVNLGDQAASLIKQLLTFSRQTPIEKQPLSLVPIVKETGKVLERTLPESIKINIQIESGLTNVRADATQMQQILMNLSVNARDAMLDGGELDISLANIELNEQQARLHGERSPGRYVRLAIRDNGPGIPPEVRDRIFEPFYTTKEIGKGTGLGLSIVHGIVESHAGHIHLTTSEQRTEFQVYLPAIQEEVPEPLDQSEIPTGSETLLLVEDDQNVREIAEKMLSNQGYWVLSAKDGETALDIYKDQAADIDLIITDVVMPGISGVELCKTLSAQYPDIRALLMSGYSDHTNLPLQDSYIVGFLQKPFERSLFATTVRNVLDQVPA